MKRILLITTALGLAACAQQEPIADYNAPYSGKGVIPTAETVEEFERCPQQPIGHLIKKGHLALCDDGDEQKTRTRTITDYVDDEHDDEHDDDELVDLFDDIDDWFDGNPSQQGGNPGNNKDVGNAGENPNGKGGWGAGDKGKSK